MSRLNKYDAKQFKASTKELFDNIEFMIGNNYMLISLDEDTGPRYFQACEELGKKASDVVQAFIEVKTPQYEKRVLTQEQLFEIEERKAKMALVNPADDEETGLNRFDKKQLQKASEDFIQNLEVMFGEKFLLVRLEGNLKDRFYNSCERLGKNPYTVIQQLIASRVIQYEERAKQKVIEKERKEYQERLDRFQQEIEETKQLVKSNELAISQKRTMKGPTLNKKDEL